MIENKKCPICEKDLIFYDCVFYCEEGHYELELMSEENWDDRMKKRIINLVTPEFVNGDDGYTMWFPSKDGIGGFTSWSLRVIADEMDRRDKAHDEEIKKYFENNK